jgi:hypothetical protein
LGWLLARGAEEKKNESDVYLADDKSGRCLPFFFFFEIFFMAFLCVSQQGEFKNTIKNFLGEAHVKNFWPKIFSKIGPENLKKSQKKVGR